MKFLTAVFLIISINLISQNYPKQYLCYKATSEIEIDGYVYDEVWQNAPWSDFFVDIEGHEMPSPYHNTRMKMLWDNDYLYIAAELAEDNIWGYLKNHDDIIYRDNDFEVFINPSGDGNNYFEIEINSLGTILDLFLEKPYNKGGSADLEWDAKGLLSSVKHTGTNNDTITKDTKWTVELAIPWDAYNSRVHNINVPKNGTKWRMNFSRVQWETEYVGGRYLKKINQDTKIPLPENNWVWSPQGVINMHVPEHWGIVTFIDEPAPVDHRILTEDGYPKYWVWMGANANSTNYQWEEIFRKLDDAGIKGFLYGGGSTLLNKVLPVAKQYDIQVHAWFWTMNRGDANPDWLSFNQLGQSLSTHKAYVDYYKFMCPALPEVKEYIKNKMDDLASVEMLDGIHMDYIRYVDVILPIGLQPKYGLVQDHIMPEYDYGYHPYMRSLFKTKYGLDPLELKDPGNNKKWINFRLDQLNLTIDEIVNHVKPKNIKITAAVFPYPKMATKMVRQNWKDWNLDCYFPMVYHNFYNEDIDWIKKVMKKNRQAIGNNSKLFCGLYLPALKKDNDLTNAIKAAYEGRSDGISFFSYSGLNQKAIDQIKSFTKTNK